MRVRLLPIVVLACVFADGPVLAGPALGLPEVSLGSSPYRSFGAYVDSGATETVLTVPEGQDFIVTMVKSEHELFEVLHGSSVILTGRMLERSCGVSIALGRARLRIEEGTTLSVRVPTGWFDGGTYFVQGYFVQAGSPYRYASGSTPSTTPATVFTADPDRDFLVRTIGIQSYSCDVYIDGSKVIPGQSWALMDPAGRSSFGGFAMGMGALVLPAGSALQLAARDGVICQYYIDGEYLIP
jgi:hypothetical protein